MENMFSLLWLTFPITYMAKIITLPAIVGALAVLAFGKSTQQINYIRVTTGVLFVITFFVYHKILPEDWPKEFYWVEVPTAIFFYIVFFLLSNMFQRKHKSK